MSVMKHLQVALSLRHATCSDPVCRVLILLDSIDSFVEAFRGALSLYTSCNEDNDNDDDRQCRL